MVCCGGGGTSNGEMWDGDGEFGDGVLRVNGNV
jgi:hypothetical protein